jgi:hypothetical protein
VANGTNFHLIVGWREFSVSDATMRSKDAWIRTRLACCYSNYHAGRMRTHKKSERPQKLRSLRVIDFRTESLDLHENDQQRKQHE